METACKIVIITVLAVVVMWLCKKLVENFFNLLTLFKASKDKNHPSRVPSSDMVLNQKTHKLEGRKEKIILPF